MVRDCPRCGLVCPPETIRCDCGYDFVRRSTDPHEYVVPPLPGCGEVFRIARYGLFAFGVFIVGIGIIARTLADGRDVPRMLAYGFLFLASGLAGLVGLGLWVRHRHKERIRDETR